MKQTVLHPVNMRRRRVEILTCVTVYSSSILVVFALQGIIEVESENVFKLAANALQVSFIHL